MLTGFPGAIRRPGKLAHAGRACWLTFSASAGPALTVLAARCPGAGQLPGLAAIQAALAMAVCRSHGTTGRETRKPGSVCWHRGQASLPKASMRQPARIARARASPSPSAAGSENQEMQEPSSHHMMGIRS